MEFGVVLQTNPPATEVVRLAKLAEDVGFSYGWAFDSHMLWQEPFVIFSLMLAETERMVVGPMVTNPGTRDWTVLASLFATLNDMFEGRTICGIGRGDSSLAYLGRAPLSVEAFEGYLAALQSYLRGEAVPFEAVEWGGTGAAALTSMAPAYTPEAAQLRWIPEGLEKVPLEVAATGPRVIAAAARIAERVTLGVGASVERVAWGVERAREENADVSLGAQIILIPHPDADLACDLAANLTAPLARFSVIGGTIVGPASAADREVFERLRDSYDMNRHGRAPAGVLTRDFIRRFAVAGPPEHCVERLLGLVEAGLSRFVVCGPLGATDPHEERVSQELLVSEVLPALRRELAAVEVRTPGALGRTP